MVSSLRQVLQTYSQIHIFCSVIQYIESIKQPVGSAHEVLAESLENVFDEVHFIVNLLNFLQPPSSQAEQLPKLPSSRHISKSLSVHLSPNSEPQLGKSKEFNNRGLKVNRNFKCYFIFLPSHTQKKSRKALHEIIRASSLSIIFVQFSFKPVYPIIVVKNFKFMENYNSWKMHLQVKILNLYIFTHMLSPPITVTTFLQVLSLSLRR